MYRHIDLLSNSADYYAAMLETMSGMMIERHFEIVAPMVRFAITEFQIPPERAFDCVSQGFTREPVTLAGGELVLYSVAAGALDVLLAVQTSQLVFQYTHIPPSVHPENPELSDAEIETIMQDPATLQTMSDAMDPNVFHIAKRFAKALADAYGFPFDEKAFDEAYGSAGSLPEGSQAQ